MIIPLPQRALTRTVAIAAAIGGAGIALQYARLGLTLTHYDARGHLIVARRIFDRITPGWQQIGAVWLPLPHLLNALPVQIDALYRTGASAVAISVASFAMACACIAWITDRLTQSAMTAVAATAVFALNPNVLYLQSTPMTEPLLLALVLLSVVLVMRWSTGEATSARAVGWTLALACLTRYEAWPVVASALAIGAILAWRTWSFSEAARRTVRIAIYPAAAIVAFTMFSRIVVGSWFADDFFVPENPAQGRPFEALSEIVWGARTLSGALLVGTAVTGMIWLLWRGGKDRGLSWLPLTLLTTAAVPWVAFLGGHPYRIRYMVPLMAIEAACAGAAVAILPRRFRPVGAVALLVLVCVELRPLDANAPMIAEARWDRPNIIERDATVTPCLARDYDGTSIMASMGSLGHYMQDLSRAGFDLRDFLHEGNGDIWLSALQHPAPFAGWMLIEEKAEGGDMLARIAREKPAFLEEFSRVCDGAGLALYRRHPAGVAPGHHLSPVD
ncbi:MAG: hypothetical protein ABL961_00205 [Vicinamibacterales bacterium]